MIRRRRADTTLIGSFGKVKPLTIKRAGLRKRFASGGNLFARVLSGLLIVIFLSIACLCAAKDSTALKSATQGAPTPQSQTQTERAKLEASQKSNHEMAQADAAELASTANQLRDELKKINAYVLPLDVMQKTETIEKLAKKIRGESRVH